MTPLNDPATVLPPTGAGCSWSWPVCVPVRREQSLCDAEVCGSRHPGEEDSAACSRARRRPGPAGSPPAHLTGGRQSVALKQLCCTVRKNIVNRMLFTVRDKNIQWKQQLYKYITEIFVYFFFLLRSFNQP